MSAKTPDAYIRLVFSVHCNVVVFAARNETLWCDENFFGSFRFPRSVNSSSHQYPSRR